MASSNQDLYLEPVVEVDQEIIDPLNVAADDIKVIIVGPGGNVCSPGGC